ncbi:MAG: hypothetical protein JWL76_1266 [Thermoleophilia bacterium]|jgi:flagellar basal body-associated protein FliL|nr:hypothetical protein [Thermoleophilia bacterium]
MIIAVAFMFACALALVPFILFAMYLVFDGDRMREEDARARVAAATSGTIAAVTEEAAPITAQRAPRREVAALPVAG